VERDIERQRTALEYDRLEGFAGDVLHHDEEHPVLLLGRDDVDDVRVVQRGQQARLTRQFTVVERLTMGNLPRDALVDPGVFGQIHGAETATAERLDDPVLAERLSTKHPRVESITVAVKTPRCHVPGAAGASFDLPDAEA